MWQSFMIPSASQDLMTCLCHYQSVFKLSRAFAILGGEGEGEREGGGRGREGAK